MGLFQMLRRSGKSKSKNEAAQYQQPQAAQAAVGSGYRQEAPTLGLHHEARASKVSLVPSEVSAMATQPLHMPKLSFSRERPGSSRSTHSTNGIFGQVRTSQRPKREARRPPVSFRKPPSMASLPNSNIGFGPDDRSDAGSILSGHGRTSSIKSASSGRHRDLLEVLEEIRPIEFRSRVLATGAKDYGEDVADRNIRQPLVTVSTPNLKGSSDFDRAYSSPSLANRTGSSSLRGRTTSPSPATATDTPRVTPVKSLRDMRLAQREAPASNNFLEPGSFSRKNKNRLSLNTYNPSGLESPRSPHSPRSITTTTDRVAVRDFGTNAMDPDQLSRKYHLSPVGSNFSIPRSPRLAASNPHASQVQPVIAQQQESELTVEEQLAEIATADSSQEQREFLKSVGQISTTRTSVRFSSQTYRSSLASSMMSRNASLDFTPLGLPPAASRLRSLSNTDAGSLDDPDNASRRRPLSMRSHRPTRSEGSEDGFRNSRTKSLVTAPSGLNNLVEVDDEHSAAVPSHDSRDWMVATPSNGSTASSSNLYSGGSARPTSRHTKATSVDSTQRPTSSRKSEDSFLSAQSRGLQSGTGWSPTTTRSEGFNIDDYISSDEESITTGKKYQRPTADGEEELLFKGEFNGALPGLPEPVDDGACPAPVIRTKRSWSRGQVSSQNRAGGRRWPGANQNLSPPEIEDDRVSVDREMPMTLLHHVRSGPDDGKMGTFGRNRKTAQDPGARPSTAGEWGSSTNVMYDNMPSPSRNQKRLSALGTLHGRSVDSAVSFHGPMGVEYGRRDMRNDSPSAGFMIPEEGDKLDHSVAMRLWKEAKSKKRADDARTIRERRMTRAFGELEEDIAAMLKAQTEMEELERGRQLTRV